MKTKAAKIINKRKKKGSKDSHKLKWTLIEEFIEKFGKLIFLLIGLMFFYFPLVGIQPLLSPVVKIQEVQAESPKLFIIPEIPNEARRRVSTAKQSKEVTDNVKQKICARFGKYCREALVISLYESGFYIQATSSADARGVFQIHCPAHKRKVGGDCNRLYDLDTNIEIAYNMFASGGYQWGPWDVKGMLQNDSIKQFLNE